MVRGSSGGKRVKCISGRGWGGGGSSSRGIRERKTVGIKIFENTLRERRMGFKLRQTVKKSVIEKLSVAIASFK